MFVVVGDPGAELTQDGIGVEAGLHASTVTLERFDERLAHPVVLERAHRREAGHEV